ncbi:hypothetical protein Cs7R123_57160 [Catellatospora sp. TT07R-123]|uniref:DUF305 domain-containing protein n=1 Tax=Catellatospora sp. TT07R-123 TaxID=2733863 RepID=UPI001B04FEF2|nr:DUF305 domain-containing protein [Catellatospora sp. TT07R-123]GHJ48374.1 hypothetical protein Cs7R123_57160 [Catellatospora sp. TT07R-123]
MNPTLAPTLSRPGSSPGQPYRDERVEPSGRRRPAWPAAAALLAVLLAGSACAGPAPAPVPPRPVASPLLLQGADVAWLQIMISMDGQLLALLERAERRGSDAAVRDLAAALRREHTPELSRLVDLRTRAGLPTEDIHKGHDMPGMVTDADLAEVDAAAASGFDALFLTRVREHLDQCVSLAKSEQQAGTEPAVRDAAAAVERERAAQRAEFDQVAKGRIDVAATGA